MSEYLQTRGEGLVRYLYLDKPARRNVLDPGMLAGIEHAVVEAEAAGATVLIIGSTSPKAFCAGAEINVLAGFDEAAMRDWELLGSRAFTRLRSSPLVSIAALDGFVLGGGLTLALHCDFRIASPHSVFAQPEIELGWIPGWGGIPLLAGVVGTQWARRLSMTGMRLDSARALEIGLVDEVAEDVAAAADQLAGQLAARSAAALRTIKARLDDSGAAGAHFDANANALLLRDERGRRAIEEFLNRRSGRGDRS